MPGMCGRYSLTTPVEGVRQVFGFLERPNLAARYNIAPTQEVPAVRLEPATPGGADGRHLVMLRWGLIPVWAKDKAIGSRMINARAETVAEKPSFRTAFAKRRCLIVADGFYEWRTEAGAKQPYRAAMVDGRPFAFAGLWEHWTDTSDGSRVESCTIVTTEANELLKPIHPRMPVIVVPADFDAWLDVALAPDAARALLRPYPAELMTVYPVSPRVNSVANDDAALIEPLTATGEPAEQPRLI
jgi:putative SOS response-associated peptidase YedK